LVFSILHPTNENAPVVAGAFSFLAGGWDSKACPPRISGHGVPDLQKGGRTV